MPKKLLLRQKARESRDSSTESSSEEESQSSQQRVAIKEMEFRKRRGEKIKALMERDKLFQDDDDDFYKNCKYFADQGDSNQEDTSYREEGNEKLDSYDSDFGKDDDDDKNQDDDKDESEYHGRGRPGRKRKVTLRVKRYQIQKKVYKKKSPKKPKPDRSGDDDDISSSEHQKEQKKKFIHDYFTQDQLIREAIQTELKNKYPIPLPSLGSPSRSSCASRKRRRTTSSPAPGR